MIHSSREMSQLTFPDKNLKESHTIESYVAINHSYKQKEKEIFPANGAAT